MNAMLDATMETREERDLMVRIIDQRIGKSDVVVN